MKRMFALSALLLVALAPAAWASNPNHPDGCHGANNVPCRPDPQPTHGNDCTHSDDHSCEVTTSTSTSTTSTAPTTTTGPSSPVASTTTTTGSQSSSTPPSLPQSSTSSSPGTTSPAAAPAAPKTAPVPATSPTLSTPAPTVSPTQPISELPATGAGTDILAGLGLWCLVSGGAALLIAQLMRGAR